jgi:hypothetical protein
MPPRTRPLAHPAFCVSAFLLAGSAVHAQPPAQPPARAGDAPALALLVRVEPVAPHRIRAIGLARIGGGL